MDLGLFFNRERILTFIKIWLLWPVYRVYEYFLNNEVKKGPLPNHIAVILDGNRRFAKKRGFKNYFIGHKYGSEKVRKFLIWFLELGLKRITLFAFSTDNFKRSKEEVDHLMVILKQKLYEIAEDEIVHNNKVKIKIIGRKYMLPQDVQEAIRYAEEVTDIYDKHLLYIAIAYSGRSELIDVIKSIMVKVKNGELKHEDITERTISQSLYIPGMPKVDLIIRTSGEKRISNFLLWQSYNSSLCFLEILWPEIRRIDLLRAIRLYQNRSLIARQLKISNNSMISST